MPTPDAVDTIIAQWRRERPDLDFAATETFGRLSRLFAHLGRAVDETFARYGLQRGEYDVLATLRRAGAPYKLTPSLLAETLMLSPSGMTNRLDRLQSAGLIDRQAHGRDRRSMFAALTANGLALTDEITTADVAGESELFSTLTGDERRRLNQITRKLLTRFETGNE
jgi:DNA-binding MarR family transcriptional regulator